MFGRKGEGLTTFFGRIIIKCTSRFLEEKLGLMETYYLSKEKLEEIRKEYESLKESRKKTSQEGVPFFLHSEEFDTDFVSFQESLDTLDLKITRLEEILKNFEIVKIPAEKERDKIQIGAIVTVEVNGSEDEFKIVGTLEANPTLGMVSNESPVGKALLGSKTGDEVAVFSPTKTIYKIKRIKYENL